MLEKPFDAPNVDRRYPPPPKAVERYIEKNRRSADLVCQELRAELGDGCPSRSGK
jgi:hypothetical protein